MVELIKFIFEYVGRSQNHFLGTCIILCIIFGGITQIIKALKSNRTTEREEDGDTL